MTPQCPHCGNVFAGPGAASHDAGMRMLLPVGRTGLSMAAGYVGLGALLIFPLAPVVVDGTHHCRPKGSWWFGEADAVAKVLPPIATEGLTMADVPALREQVRATIASELVRLRNAPLPPVAALIAPDMALPAAVAAAMLTAASAAPRPTSASTESGARGDDMGEHE